MLKATWHAILAFQCSLSELSPQLLMSFWCLPSAIVTLPPGPHLSVTHESDRERDVAGPFHLLLADDDGCFASAAMAVACYPACLIQRLRPCRKLTRHRLPL
uniref:Secreted protein n=1 Tax=Oryza punctata TaxID=4537 RepID=A0A0E0LEM8_ORYPU